MLIFSSSLFLNCDYYDYYCLEFFLFNTYFISSSFIGCPLKSNLSSYLDPLIPKILKPYILGINLGGPLGIRSVYVYIKSIRLKDFTFKKM